MSKILCPSLRLGYIVAPEPLVDSVIKIRSAMLGSQVVAGRVTANSGIFISL